MTFWGELRRPPNRYRSVPFWSWNDKLEIAELERQIEEMHNAGIGGFFMHARSGLKTPYMGEEWMAAIRICIEKSKSLGMEPWLYDENGWPSGFADGQVPAMGLDFQQKRIAYEEAPFRLSPERTIAYYARAGNGYRRLMTGEESNADLRIFYMVNPYYIDTLSRKAVRAFIDSTYEAYWDKFGEEFGEVVRGVFTDEPQFARGQNPWSFDLEEEFGSRYGYDIRDVLPSLFFTTEGCGKARYDYWECVTAMFTQAYAKQIGEWCHSRGWVATGHVVDEQELMNQITSVGDPMAFYEYLQIPGCDWLGRFVSEEPIVPKQVSSVARQLGKKRTITESYGCSGWNVGFQDLKRIGEWQFVHGINSICQHLQGYSLKGLRKRDYPPSLFYQQPWWDDYRAYNDYFARLSLLLSEGNRQADVLLLHPIRSAWVAQCGHDSSAIIPYHQSFAQLTRWMCQSFLEHDYGSESIIETHGSVCDGRFIVGQASYNVVVIPPSISLNKRTVQLLQQFMEQGGRLIAFSPYPTQMNGAESEELKEILGYAQKPGWSREELLQAVSAAAAPFIRVTDSTGKPIAADSINVQTLTLEGAFLYYLVNSGEECYEEIQVELLRSGTVEMIDLTTGDVVPLNHVGTEDGVRFTLCLLPAQSHMLRLVPVTAKIFKGENLQANRIGAAARTMSDGAKARIAYSLDRPWTIAYSDLNSLTLDTCRLRIEDGEWSDRQPIIFIQEQLLAIGGPVHIELEFEFQVDFDVSVPRELYMVMEQPETTQITLNGCVVNPVSCGWWRDTSFRKIDIRGLAVRGSNTLIIASYFSNSSATYETIERAAVFESEGNKLTLDSEIESVYLLGEFGVRSKSSYTEGERRAVRTDGPFELTEPPTEVQAGDFVRQGLPFFAGKLRLRQQIQLNHEVWSVARLRFPVPPDAIVTRLIVNGEQAHTFLWEPYEADIGALLRRGDNIIELELANSCRNLLGPHHHIKGEVYKVGPDSFKDKPGWTDKDLDPNTRIYQDHYSFVRLGFQDAPRIELQL
ncbi:glycosyl hydrolase [Paenibacillus vulneris]|uniref:Glycosyl hydrolase n=1 Tax=Paenibacillus vulneris TaxID=1133364 RepID=A0ABW3UQN1_9BACL